MCASAVQRATSPTEYGKSTSPVCGSRTGMRALGWKQVEIINSDLGLSAGIASAQREGFERVLSWVALGEVGIVASREVSRLSRTDKDWCRLLEVCQIFGTLIADEQQVYDLNYLDDQLVLGIKGTLQRRRAQGLTPTIAGGAGVQSTPRRNCLKDYRLDMPVTLRVKLWCTPIAGFTKRSDSCSPSFEDFGACVRHSNGSMTTTSSCRPTHQGTGLVWKIPSQSLIRDILCNPLL